MQGICLIGFLSLLFIHPVNLANPPAVSSKTEEIVLQEFIGSFDFDENNNLVFIHFPSGSIKPAIVYLHKAVFENRTSKYKALKYLNRNVKVKGNIIKLGEEEYFFVNQLELMIIEL